VPVHDEGNLDLAGQVTAQQVTTNCRSAKAAHDDIVNAGGSHPQFGLLANLERLTHLVGKLAKQREHPGMVGLFDVFGCHGVRPAVL